MVAHVATVAFLGLEARAVEVQVQIASGLPKFVVVGLPDKAVGEFGLLVRTDLQGHGLGWKLLKQVIEFARAEGVGRVEGFVLTENARMLAMCREFGFEVKHHPEEGSLSIATLDLSGEGPA